MTTNHTPPADQTPEPIRKSSLPCITPAEEEFFTWFPHPDGGGDMVRGQRQRGVQVRRRVSYSDWEPVRPDRWADEPESDARTAAPMPPADPAALRDRIAAAIWERQNPGRRWADCEYRWRADAEADAEAVLAVLPPPVSRADVLREAANSLACLGPEDSRVSGPVAWTEAVETLRRMADEAQPGTEAHACRNCEGIDPDTCLMNPNRPPEQCPNSEFDGYGLQCQKPAGHNLCTFEEQPAAGARQDGAES